VRVANQDIFVARQLTRAGDAISCPMLQHMLAFKLLLDELHLDEHWPKTQPDIV
jgi:hypothetical protein